MPAIAVAAPARQTISLPAGPLSEALIALAVQTGASIGYPGNLPRLSVRAVHGKMNVEEALRRLLAGTGLEAMSTGPMAWRIVVKPKAAPKTKPARKAVPRTMPPPSTPRPTAPAKPVPQPDIVVTATKHGDLLQTTPLSALVISSESLSSFGQVPTTSAVASLSDGMVLTNLGPGRNRSFMRGIADSPFNGVTQSTVALEIDEARVTFNAPDPDLRLVDVERIELLEGPQGPMHGTGALGGVYRVIPHAPRLDTLEGEVDAGLESVSGGGTGWNGSAMVNLPLIPEKLGFRAVGYGAREAGWIDRPGPSGHNSNVSKLLGARGDMQWKPAADWTVDLAGIVQLLHVADSQYATATAWPYQRTGSIAEPHDNDFMNGRLTVRGKIGDAQFVSATSWTYHEVDSALDASIASATFGQAAPLLFEDDRIHRLFNQELRLSGGDRWRWLAGLSYLSATTHINAELRPAETPAITIGKLDQANSEIAAFGDLSVPLGARLRLDAGARIFQASSDDERQLPVGTTSRRTSRTGISPSASISWKPSEKHFLYLRYASAFRPAGLSPFAPDEDAEFQSDELKSIELGMRLNSANKRWALSGTTYFANWNHIQSDYLLSNGLIATRNSGTGQIYGAEARLGWHNPHWQLSGGFDLQHARLEKPEPGLALSADHALPIVPPYKAHLIARHIIDLDSGNLSMGMRGNWFGAARLSLDPALNRRIGARTQLGFDASFQANSWTFDVALDNALGSHADTFGYGNPFSIATIPQSTPMRPRTFRIGIRKRWH